MTALLEAGRSGASRSDALLSRGIVRLWGNELDGAEHDLTEVLSLRDEPPFAVFVNASAYRAELLLRSGAVAAAAELAEETVTLVEDADAVWLVPLARSVAAFARSVQGEIDRARAHATVAVEVSEATGLAPGEIWSSHARLRVAAAAQDHSGVVEMGDHILGQRWGTLLPEGVHHWRATYVESLIVGERIDDAIATLGQLEQDAACGDDTSVRTDACRARGLVEAARGCPARADDAFAAGLALDPVAARPFERARLELDAGSFRRRQGQRRDASSLLTDAATRFDQLGAEPWSRRAARELEACGLRPAKRTGSPTTALTAQEATVARLVAGGRSNKEVAAELVISVKTVEHHLSRIYDKLGVRSRTQLAVALHPASEAVRV